jgi:hypothetical protein
MHSLGRASAEYGAVFVCALIYVDKGAVVIERGV